MGSESFAIFGAHTLKTATESIAVYDSTKQQNPNYYMFSSELP